MFKKLFGENQEKQLFFILLIVFIFTELIDDLFDYLLGNSIVHSLIQLVIFLTLFFFVAKMFLGYYKKMVNKLIPEELMAILRIIKDAENKGVLVNQRKVMSILNITKPTLKKRVDGLIALKYIFFEKKGNNIYIKLTKLGNSSLN